MKFLPVGRQMKLKMKFIIQDTNKSISDVIRTIGYQTTYLQNGDETSVIRKLGMGDYPRFHLYIKENDDGFVFNLHIDQKKPSYKGAHAHSGEYDGELVEEEAERIKQLLM